MLFEFIEFIDPYLNAGINLSPVPEIVTERLPAPVRDVPDREVCTAGDRKKQDQ